MNRTPLFVIFVILLSVLIAGCTLVQQEKTAPERHSNGTTGARQAPAPKPGDYFPLTTGSTWEYAGTGNEYASFTREVLFAEGNRAQIRESNGGTVSAVVFETTDDAVVRIINREESYEPVNMLDNEQEERAVILKAPLKEGTTWSLPHRESEIIDVDAVVATPAGIFTDCIKVKTTGKYDVIFEYFKNGVGLVKREFVSGDTRVTSALEKYEVKQP
ncbi:MAG: hypothetical protein QHH75_08905 [Bacillota bacterium]|nr:hypothetical protein [Bacillota bacterium]